MQNSAKQYQYSPATILSLLKVATRKIGVQLDNNGMRNLAAAINEEYDQQTREIPIDPKYLVQSVFNKARENQERGIEKMRLFEHRIDYILMFIGYQKIEDFEQSWKLTAERLLFQLSTESGPPVMLALPSQGEGNEIRHLFEPFQGSLLSSDFLEYEYKTGFQDAKKNVTPGWIYLPFRQGWPPFWLQNLIFTSNNWLPIVDPKYRVNQSQIALFPTINEDGMALIQTLIQELSQVAEENSEAPTPKSGGGNTYNFSNTGGIFTGNPNIKASNFFQSDVHGLTINNQGNERDD